MSRMQGALHRTRHAEHVCVDDEDEGAAPGPPPPPGFLHLDALARVASSRPPGESFLRDDAFLDTMLAHAQALLDTAASRPQCSAGRGGGLASPLLDETFDDALSSLYAAAGGALLSWTRCFQNACTKVAPRCLDDPRTVRSLACLVEGFLSTLPGSPLATLLGVISLVVQARDATSWTSAGATPLPVFAVRHVLGEVASALKHAPPREEVGRAQDGAHARALLPPAGGCAVDPSWAAEARSIAHEVLPALGAHERRAVEAVSRARATGRPGAGPLWPRLVSAATLVPGHALTVWDDTAVAEDVGRLVAASGPALPCSVLACCEAGGGVGALWLLWRHALLSVAEHGEVGAHPPPLLTLHAAECVLSLCQALGT